MTERPVQPRDASTVILVRRGQPVGEPWQCFMVRRHVLSDFAADVFVFPGGKVDEGDYDERLAMYVVGHPAIDGAGDGLSTWRALRLAAVRELFEEAGVLLATRDGDLADLSGHQEQYSRLRQELQSGDTTLLEMAQSQGLRYPLDRLHPFSRWITPEPFTRRYDTRFFVAYMPPHQEPLHDALETTDSVWIAPDKALEEYSAGRFPLVFATEKHLERMARYRSIEDLIASTAASDLEPVMPKVVEDGGTERFLIPGDPGYL
jgi:8-oxo-dGTP pyrophosphatase MutT (NUDIX family)